MQFEWFVSLRYLKAKRKQGFISLITLISVAGVALGVMALITVLSVMTGFTDELRDKILGINSHIIVQQLGTQIEYPEEVRKQLDQLPEITATTPYIFTQTMITSDRGGTGAIVRGIDPDSANAVLDLDKYVQGCRLTDLTIASNDPRALPKIILGNELAKQLRVFKGERIRLISTNGPLTPVGIIPRVKTYEVAGIFKTEMYEYDSSLAYVSLASAQEFLELGQSVHGVEVKLTDIYQARNVAKSIESYLGPGYIAKDWIQMNKNLFSALQLEKTALFIIVTLVVIVAAFNIVSTLTMMVMEKNKDIAILKAMGATVQQIRNIFIYEGLIIGLSGTFLGLLGGLTACKLLSRYQFIKLPEVYPISILPVKVLVSDVLIISICAVVISLAATLYPSWQASRVDPATALRYE
nr:lipoprotein-releasing ABC transporter permease subunit [Desulfobulbaceae bacterium]